MGIVLVDNVDLCIGNCLILRIPQVMANAQTLCAEDHTTDLSELAPDLMLIQVGTG